MSSSRHAHFHHPRINFLYRQPPTVTHLRDNDSLPHTLLQSMNILSHIFVHSLSVLQRGMMEKTYNYFKMELILLGKESLNI